MPTDTVLDILRDSLSTDGSIRITGGTVGGATEVTLVEVRDRLANIQGYVDQLETFTDSLETLNTQILAATDGLETLLGTSNTSLAAIQAATDDVESLITTTNAALSSIQTSVDGLEGFTDELESKIDTTNTRLTSINDKTPSLGQAVMATCVPVVLASDHTSISVTGTISVANTVSVSPAVIRTSTATVTSFADTTTNTTIFSATSLAASRIIYNNSTSGAYVKWGTTCSTVDFTNYLAPYSRWEFPSNPLYTGRVDVVWVTNESGFILATETT